MTATERLQQLWAELQASERERFALLFEQRRIEAQKPPVQVTPKPAFEIQVFDHDGLLLAHYGEFKGGGKSLANALLALATRLRGRNGFAIPDARREGDSE